MHSNLVYKQPRKWWPKYKHQKYHFLTQNCPHFFRPYLDKLTTYQDFLSNNNPTNSPAAARTIKSHTSKLLPLWKNSTHASQIHALSTIFNLFIKSWIRCTLPNLPSQNSCLIPTFQLLKWYFLKPFCQQTGTFSTSIIWLKSQQEHCLDRRALLHQAPSAHCPDITAPKVPFTATSPCIQVEAISKTCNKADKTAFTTH